MERTLAPRRKEWLDALRGLAMFLVVLGHCLPGRLEKYYFVILTSPVKIPLFFAVSGYLFNGRDGKQGAFYLNLLRKIIIPGFALFLCTRIIHLPTRGIEYVTAGLLEFISGDNYWYIPACVLGEILFFYILKFFKKDWQICLAATVCCVLGFVMDALNFGDLAMFNRAFIVQVFFLLGYLFRRREEFFKKLHWSILLGAALMLLGMIAAGIYLFPGRGIDVHTNSYYGGLWGIPFSFVLIIGSTLLLMTFGVRFGGNFKILAFAGRHTLVTYIFHTYFLAIGKRILPLSDSAVLPMIGKCLLLTVVAMAVCCAGGLFINWVFPELMGRKRRKKEKILPTS